MSSPRVCYADSGGCSIAYQVIGDGPFDLVFVPGLVTHLDLQWGDPVFAHTLERLGSISRLIVFDNRGVGLSDRVESIPTLDERVADVLSVMESTGSEKAVLLGHCNGGPTATLFAATYPARTSALILCSTFAKGAPDEEHPGAVPPAAYKVASEVMDHWGEGRSIALYNPSRERAGVYRRMYASFERAALSRGMARAALESTMEIDVTAVLGSVQAPTLVLHCVEDFMSVEAARYVAANIPDGQFIELPGGDHAPFSGNMSHELVDRITEFVTGGQQLAVTAPHNFGTILFTDIVNSTPHLASLGDVEWQQQLTAHDLAVRDQVERHGGECVKSTGDGFLITFEAAASAVRCARSILSDAEASLGVEIRAALHAGSYEHVGQDVAGMAVHVAARLLGHAGPGEILVSEAVRQLVVGSELDFAPRGPLPLRGLEKPCVAYVLVKESIGAPRPATWTGGRSDGNRVADRALLALARRTPRLTRAFTQLASRPRPQT